METYRNPVHKRGSGDRQQSEEKMYRNPVRREDLGIGSNRKKVVSESGMQRGAGNRQRLKESCTGIRYARENLVLMRALMRLEKQ